MPAVIAPHRSVSKATSWAVCRGSARIALLVSSVLTMALVTAPSGAASPTQGRPTAPSDTAVVAETWAELDAAFRANDSVSLGADITAPGGASLMYRGNGLDEHSDLNAITLDLDGHHLTITDVDDGHAAIGVSSAARLHIIDTAGGGQLVAVGGRYAAGIGGSGSDDRTPAAKSGEIYIHGANVSATGGDHGAGIGGGIGGGSFSIYIVRQSRVVATGTNGGAGIGTGDSVNGVGASAYFIYLLQGSVVTAAGGENGAGIGGGRSGKGGQVFVSTAASVTAIGGDNAAGVGGGAFAAGGLVAVGAQGSLTAQGGARGAGIGGGATADGGSAYITQDGSVTAASGPAPEDERGSAIGPGGRGTHFGLLRTYGKLAVPAGSDLVIPAPAVAYNFGFIRLGGRLLGTGTLRNGGWIVGTGQILAGGDGPLQITSNNYVLSYDPNGGQLHGDPQQTVYACSVYDSQQHVPYATRADVPPVHFLGWYTEPVGGIRITGTTNFCYVLASLPHSLLHPTALYAHWSS